MIRTIICEKDKKYKNLLKDYKSYPKAFVIAVSSSLVTTMGISNPIALGVSTLVLLSLSQATKNAFCKMTDSEVLNAISDKVDQAEKNKSDALKRAFGDLLDDEDTKKQ